MTDPLYQFLYRRKILNINDSAPPEVQFDRWMCDRIDEAIEADRKRRHFPPDAEAERQWQPIETAPKDGTPILIWQPGNPKHNFGAADDNRYAIGYWRTWEPNGGWGNRNQQTVISTHWMPLPQPPKEADRD